MRHLFHSLACLALFTAHSVAAAPDPLRLVSEQVELIVEVKRPRQLVEAVTNLEVAKQLQNVDALQDIFASTELRQLGQLLAHFEKQLGSPWPELLERIGGGGAVLAVQYGAQPAPALLVIQSTDEAALQNFVRLALQVAEHEVARQESRGKLVKGSYREIETVRIGQEFHAALAGSALVISNSDKMLQRSLDLHLPGGKSMAKVKELARAREQLPADPLVFAWVNMERVRQLPAAKPVFSPEAQDPNLKVLLVGPIDLLRRSPYIASGLYAEKNELLLATRLAAGREGMGPGSALHVPNADRPGSRPLLEPKGVLASSSYYLDVARIWEDRDKLFNKEQVKALEEFDQTTAKFLSGNQLSKLMAQAGPYQRVVVVTQPTGAYSTAPRTAIPGFALVLELREPEPFARSVNTIVRGAALLVGTQVRLKLIEEKEGDHEIVGYRFDEKSPLKNDVNNLRFNFSPCFVQVGNQIVFSSTLELCHQLADLLAKEAKDPAPSHRATSIARVYSAGAADLLKVFEDPLVAQLVLNQGITVAEARKQVHPLIELIRSLGVLQIEEGYGAQEFSLDVRLRLGK